MAPCRARASSTACSSEAWRVARAATVVLLFTTLGCEKPPTKPACSVGGEPIPTWETGSGSPAPTRSALIARLGGQTPGPATWIVPAASNGPAQKGNYLRAPRGEVTLHGIAGTTRLGEEFRFVGTALVDYAPAEARWTFWDAERTEVIREHSGTGLAFATRERVIAFDVKIVGLDESAAHEIQTFIELAPADASDTSDADVRRWIVADDPQSRTATATCESSRPSPFSELEGEMRSRGLTTGLARPVGGDERSPLTGPSRVEVSVENGEGKEFALVPLVDGIPVGPARFVRVSPGAGEVAYRGVFDIPRRPRLGFIAAVWRDPWSARPDSLWTTNFASSNFVAASDGDSR